jgi:hypothetical protein
LYALPASVLSRIKDVLAREIPVRLDGPALTSLFVYDNDTFIVESFLDQPTDVTVTVSKQIKGIRDLLTDEILAPGVSPNTGGFGGRRGTPSGPRTTFTMQIKPHSYRVFQCQ